MKVAISCLLHGHKHKVVEKYPKLDIIFVGDDRDKKAKSPPSSTNHIFIMRKFCSHSLFYIIKNNFSSDKITMVNGGLSELFKLMDEKYIHATE